MDNNILLWVYYLLRVDFDFINESNFKKKIKIFKKIIIVSNNFFN